MTLALLATLGIVTLLLTSLLAGRLAARLTAKGSFLNPDPGVWPRKTGCTHKRTGNTVLITTACLVVQLAVATYQTLQLVVTAFVFQGLLGPLPVNPFRAFVWVLAPSVVCGLVFFCLYLLTTYLRAAIRRRRSRTSHSRIRN